MQGFHQSFWSRRTVSHSVATSWRRSSVARRLSPREHRLPFSERLLEHGGAVSSLAAQQWKKQRNPAGPGRQTQADSNVTKKFIWRQTMAGGWTSWSNVDGCGRKTWVNPCFKIVKWEKRANLKGYGSLKRARDCDGRTKVDEVCPDSTPRQRPRHLLQDPRKPLQWELQGQRCQWEGGGWRQQLVPQQVNFDLLVLMENWCGEAIIHGMKWDITILLVQIANHCVSTPAIYFFWLCSFSSFSRSHCLVT